MLVVAVVSVDAYPFLAFSDLTCHLEDTVMRPDSNETELGSNNQEAFQSAGKNIRIVLVPCCAWKCVPAAISSGVDNSDVLQ